MLGKLIKHEWKSVYKIGCIMIGAVVLVTLLGCISFHIPPVTAMLRESVVFEKNALMSFVVAMSMVGSFILYILTLMGAVYGIYIYLCVHFYKTMYTDEGYLTNTLPVNAHQLLFSKILVGGIWSMLIGLTLVVSIVLLTGSIGLSVMQTTAPELTMAEIWSAIGNGISEIREVFELLDVQMVHYTIVLCLIVLTGPFMGMSMLFGAITIGQLSKKHKVMMSIFAYIGISIISGILSFVLEIAVAVASGALSGGPANGSMMVQYDLSLFQTLVMGVALYFISHFIITKKLNLD